MNILQVACGRFILHPDWVFDADIATIRDCIKAIQRGGANVAVAVDGQQRMTGIVTDGDVRRAWLNGQSLDDPAALLVQTAPLTVAPDESRSAILELMQARGISQVPVVDGEGRLCGLHLMREFLGRVTRPNTAVILAGGRGTRLMPMTSQIPKPMLPVAGRPILERIVTHLVGFGITEIALAVAFRADAIQSHFGSGERFGCKITYLSEDPDVPLGTGGPLALAARAFPDNADPTLVLNGDLVTQFDVAEMLSHHESEGAQVTIGVINYAHEVPFGVLELSEGRVVALDEKPLRIETVSSGIYVLEPEVISRVPPGEFLPITAVIEDSLARGERVVPWNCGQDWIDIGRPNDLARARGEM